MGIRTGQQYIEGLRAGARDVWISGESVRDVTAHPAFARPTRQIANLFDMQHDPAHADVLTYTVPETGEKAATSMMPARSLDDLVKRHNAYRAWAEATFGLMGRSPDFVNAAVLAFYEAQDFFGRRGQRFADNVVRYYEYVRDRQPFLTHALISPQTDRSRSSSEQAEEFLHLGMVRESADGIVVSGARMLATLGPLADEVLVYNTPGLKPDEGRYGLVFALPIDTPGVRQICREPYDVGTRSNFDHPLAGNFEEPDTLIIFDDVLVPWDRVFLYNDAEAANRLMADTAIRNHTMHQTGVRGLVKLQFVVGIIMALAEAVRTHQFAQVQAMLGECINYIEIIRAALFHAERAYERTPGGSLRPAGQPLEIVRTMLPGFYPRVIEVLQTIAGGGLMMTPTARDFASPAGADIAKYFQGAGGLAASERIRLYKLAWDICGEAFGMRQLQYERYYAGDPFRNLGSVYQAYDKTVCRALVERAVSLAGAPLQPYSTDLMILDGTKEAQS